MVNNIFNYLPEKKIISNFLKETNRQQHYQIKLQIYTKVHKTVRTSHGHCVVLHSSQLLITRLETRHHLTTIYYIYIYIYNSGLIRDWKRKIKDGVKSESTFLSLWLFFLVSSSISRCGGVSQLYFSFNFLHNTVNTYD